MSDRLRRLELIGKHVRVNAFQERVEFSLLEGLGERIDRAKARAASLPALPAPPIPPERRRLELIGKHVRVNAFQERVEFSLLEGLGERIDRAKARAASLPALPAPPIVKVASAPLPSRVEQPAPAAPPAPPSPPPPLPKPAYKPIMPAPEPAAPWPSFGGFAATDYDPT
ncbi:hypothetical protein [Bradyrhizobium elkanii]